MAYRPEATPSSDRAGVVSVSPAAAIEIDLEVPCHPRFL
jgi:hypothetical protein